MQLLRLLFLQQGRQRRWRRWWHLPRPCAPAAAHEDAAGADHEQQSAGVPTGSTSMAVLPRPASLWTRPTSSFSVPSGPSRAARRQARGLPRGLFPSRSTHLISFDCFSLHRVIVWVIAFVCRKTWLDIVSLMHEHVRVLPAAERPQPFNTSTSVNSQ